MDGISCANSRCTVEWVQLMEGPRGKAEWNFLVEDTELILDRAPWHLTKDVTDIFEDKGITPHYIPAAGGRWLNPVDQSINREFRREFVRLQHERGNEHKLSNIIRAYYSISDDTVRSSFHHTGLITQEDPELLLQRRSEEGYAAPRARKDKFDVMKEAFMKWANECLRSLRTLHPSTAAPQMMEQTDTTGNYWTTWGLKTKHQR